MALDGIFLHCLQREIADGAVGDRVDKIQQPTKEEIVLTLRGRSGAKKLLLSCRPDSALRHGETPGGPVLLGRNAPMRGARVP